MKESARGKMNLYLLRHGQAAERDARRFPDDSQRPLLAKGRDRIHRLAAAFPALAVRSDRILTSPYRRAAQTAEIVAAAMGREKRLECRDELAPGGDLKALVRYLNHLRPGLENIMLVGHEPDLTRFIARLISDDPGVALDLKKGGLAKVVVKTELRYDRCASLAWLLTPKQMSLLA